MESENPKEKYGRCKPSMALIPSTALVLTAKVFELGAKKYGAYNWREVPAVQAMTYLNGCLRHLHSYLDGEDIDEESGVSHLAHAIACCAIIIDSYIVGNLDDNRPAPAPTAGIIKELTTSL